MTDGWSAEPCLNGHPGYAKIAAASNIPPHIHRWTIGNRRRAPLLTSKKVYASAINANASPMPIIHSFQPTRYETTHEYPVHFQRLRPFPRHWLCHHILIYLVKLGLHHDFYAVCVLRA